MFDMFGTSQILTKHWASVPLLIPEILRKNTISTYRLKLLFLYIPKCWNSSLLKMLGRWVPANDEDPSGKFYNILDVVPTSTRKHDM